jgi:hypothetical protein
MSTVWPFDLHPSGRKERPLGRFTLKMQKIEENLQKLIFLSCRTHMYNQLITQSNSISKLSRDIRESSDFNKLKDFPIDRKFKIDNSTHAMCVCVKTFPIRYDYH